jgi:hypothetical protein
MYWLAFSLHLYRFLPRLVYSSTPKTKARSSETSVKFYRLHGATFQKNKKYGGQKSSFCCPFYRDSYWTTGVKNMKFYIRVSIIIYTRYIWNIVCKSIVEKCQQCERECIDYPLVKEDHVPWSLLLVNCFNTGQNVWQYIVTCCWKAGILEPAYTIVS